jgi:hypothetical protein
LDEIIPRFFSDLSTVVTESTGELTILFLILLFFVIIVLMGFYVYNRTQKLNRLDRQIPASLVQSHLNSIIKNSNELKESLFIEDKKSTKPDNKDDVLALKEELREKEKIILELAQKKSMEVSASQPSGSAPIILENQLSNEQLEKIIKERDSLLLRVSDYQKAEEDFANLKKLKQENEELKIKLAGAGIEPISKTVITGEEIKPTPEPIILAEEAKPVEVTQIYDSEKSNIEEEFKITSPEEIKDVAKEEKSAEDLLKEFEKMLG